MRIERTDEQINQLIAEIVQAPVDPTVRYTVLALLSYLMNKETTESKNVPAGTWKGALRINSKLPKGTQLEQLHFGFVNILSELAGKDKGIARFLNLHEQFDLLFNVPDDDMAKSQQLLENLAQVAVYFMRSNDMKELNLPNKALANMAGTAWSFNAPRNENEGISFKIE